MNAKRYVKVTPDTVGKLSEIFNCTERSVMNALTYRSDSETAKKIRWTAVKEFGGKAMAHVPECETMHVLDETENGERLFALRQWFDNGARLQVNRETGVIMVWNKDGHVVGKWMRATLSQLAEIQMFAASL